MGTRNQGSEKDLKKRESNFESKNIDEDEVENNEENSYQTDSFVVADDEESNDSIVEPNNYKFKKEEKLSLVSEDSFSLFPAKKRRLKKIGKKIESEEDEKEESDLASDNSFLEKEKISPKVKSVIKQKSSVLQRLFPDEENSDQDSSKKKLEDKNQNLDIDLEQIFEPGDLAQNYETPIDRLIVSCDRPERLQILFRNLDLPSNEELVQETYWIVEALCSKNNLPSLEIQNLKPKVLKVLEYIRLAFCEIPFIWHYKKSEISSDQSLIGKVYELNRHDLWTINNLNLNWINIYNKYQSIVKQFDILRQQTIIPQVINEMVNGCYSTKTLNYLSDYIEYNLKKFLTSDEISKVLERGSIQTIFKRIENKTIAYEINRLGIHRICESISLNTEQLI